MNTGEDGIEDRSVKLYDDRVLILSKLNDVLDFMQSKALNGRINKDDKTRLQWFKSYVYACKVYNEVKKDVDIELLNKNMELIRMEIRDLNNESKRIELVERIESMEDELTKLREAEKDG